jgi:hypothetical protein
LPQNRERPSLFGAKTIPGRVEVACINASFNLYRADSPDGDFVKINEPLLVAQGNGSGDSYSFFDAAGSGDYAYLLEDIDTSGVATRRPPVSAEPGSNHIFLPFIGVAR